MKTKIAFIMKRLADILVSIVGIILILPVLLIIFVAIKLNMPGPIFFFQERVGKNGKVFKIYKLRTMKVDESAERTFDISKDAERTTRLGEFLRRYKIDESVQLFNVLKGDMSLVGPRPTLKVQTDKYSDYERQRLKMSPGMTGLAQINGNASLSWEDRIVYDIEYINNFSIWMDLKILFKTVFIVIFGEKRFTRTPQKENKQKIEYDCV